MAKGGRKRKTKRPVLTEDAKDEAKSLDEVLGRFRRPDGKFDVLATAKARADELARFVELLAAHTIRREGGLLVESVYDAIALNEAVQPLEAAFTQASIELIASKAKPQGRHSASWHIGKDGVHPTLGSAIDKVLKAIVPSVPFKKVGTSAKKAPPPIPSLRCLSAGDLVPEGKVELLRSALRLLQMVSEKEVGSGLTGIPVLTPVERAVLDILLEVPAGRGITGVGILDRLVEMKFHGTTQSDLTTRIIPSLRDLRLSIPTPRGRRGYSLDRASLPAWVAHLPPVEAMDGQ